MLGVKVSRIGQCLSQYWVPQYGNTTLRYCEAKHQEDIFFDTMGLGINRTWLTVSRLPLVRRSE